MSPNQIVMLVLFTAGVILAASCSHVEAKDEHNYKPELLPSLNTMAAALLTCHPP